MQRSSPLQMVNYEAPAVQTEAAPRTTQNQKNKTIIFFSKFSNINKQSLLLFKLLFDHGLLIFEPASLFNFNHKFIILIKIVKN